VRADPPRSCIGAIRMSPRILVDGNDRLSIDALLGKETRVNTKGI